MPAQYWGVVQPYYHHTCIPYTGVYLYSFALEIRRRKRTRSASRKGNSCLERRHNQIAGKPQSSTHPLRRGNAREEPGEKPATMGKSRTSGAISRRAPTVVFIENRLGEASTTKRLWVRTIGACLRYSLVPTTKYAERQGLSGGGDVRASQYGAMTEPSKPHYVSQRSTSRVVH
jgi:hypothetical protein